MSAFSLRDPLQTGLTILEASAGTGKTYSLAGLATRWIAEYEVKASELCIVSFTELATAELRGRVRERIAEAAIFLQTLMVEGGASTSDDVLLAISTTDGLEGDARQAELHRRRQRLETALSEFDGAIISTIHGFCTRVLASGGTDISAPLTSDDSDVVEVVVDQLLGTYGVGANLPAPVSKIIEAVKTRLQLPDAHLWTLSRAIGADSNRLDVWFNGNGEKQKAALTEKQFAQANAVDEVAQLVEKLTQQVWDRRLAQRVRTYDSMLTDTRSLLRGENGAPGAAVIEALRNWFRVVLIDEFQDTDRVQWDIFRLAFLENNPYLSGSAIEPGAVAGPEAVVMVGDPKQSIYRFRAAELSAYLDAVNYAKLHNGHIQSLGRNFRSDAPLLEGLEALFTGVTFGSDQVQFTSVLPDPKRLIRSLDDGKEFSIEFRTLPALGSQPDERLVAVDDVAAEVVRLLREAKTLDGENINASDIGILVRSNADADSIANALEAAGVPAARNASDSVLASPAASQWRTLLLALERPGVVGRVRAAALGWFFNYSPADVVSLEDEGAAAISETLRRWSVALADSGLPALLAALRQGGYAGRVLSRRGGERDLTDFDHVVELLQSETGGRRVAPSALLEIFDALGSANGDEDEAVASELLARRIDRDDDTVKVLTVHKAKGLEFTIVLCPLLWKKRSNRRGLHHAEVTAADGTSVRLIGTAKLADASTKPFEQIDLADKEENIAEDMRLLYVALTRAKARLVVWTSVDIEGSSLQSLLGHEPNGAIGSCRVPEIVAVPQWTPAAQTPPQLESGEAQDRIDRNWKVWSFTGISKVAEHNVNTNDDRPVGAGNDEGIDTEPAVDPLLVQPAGRLQPAVRGAAFGDMVHKLLEDLDFSEDNLDTRLLEACEASLKFRQLRTTPADLAAGLADSLRATLGPQLGVASLTQLPEIDRLDELHFDLPLGQFNALDIAKTVLAHPDPNPILWPWFERVANGELNVPLQGMLNGSIDLVARASLDGEQRFWLADYKTNHRADGDYSTGAMVEMMEEHGYALQATLYSVALHRYLRWRLPNYNPDTHFVGSAYLFLRGMSVTNAPTDPRGVLFWRIPTPALVALDRLFDKGTS